VTRRPMRCCLASSISASVGGSVRRRPRRSAKRSRVAVSLSGLTPVTREIQPVLPSES